MNFDLSAVVLQESPVGDMDNFHPVNFPDSVDNFFFMRLVSGIHREVSYNDALPGSHDIHGPDVPAIITENGRDFAEHPDLI